MIDFFRFLYIRKPTKLTIHVYTTSYLVFNNPNCLTFSGTFSIALYYLLRNFKWIVI